MPEYPLARHYRWWFGSWDPAGEPTTTVPQPSGAEAALADALAVWQELLAPVPANDWSHEYPVLGWDAAAEGRRTYVAILRANPRRVANQAAIDAIAGVDALARAEVVCDLPAGDLFDAKLADGWGEVVNLLAPAAVDVLGAADHPAGPVVVAERLYRCLYPSRGLGQGEPVLNDLLLRTAAVPATPATEHLAAWHYLTDPLRLWLRIYCARMHEPGWERMAAAADRVHASGADPRDWRVRWVERLPAVRTLASAQWGLHVE